MVRSGPLATVDRVMAASPSTEPATGLPSAPVAPARPEELAWSSIRAVLRRHGLAAACVATAGLHLALLTREVGSDEGGFAVVAAHWHEAGPYLYGPLWVDRPPGLILTFAVADHLGPYGIRLVAACFAVVLVAGVAWAARAAAGASAGVWAAWAAFAFSTSPLLDSQGLDGELVAAAFVALSMAAMLAAARTPTARHRVVLGLVAGAAAGTAPLVKQNFTDALVFAAVFLLLRRLPKLALAVVVGVALPVLVALAWSIGHGGPEALQYAAIGFRADASAVMEQWSWARPEHRLHTMVLASLLSGLLPLSAYLAWTRRASLGLTLRPRPTAAALPWALVAAVAVELVGVLGGGNYWKHYLIALIPIVALAAGVTIATRAHGWVGTRFLVIAAAAVTTAVVPVAAAHAAQTPSSAWTTGRWVAASAAAGDTVTVTISNANVIQASGLAPGYPYLWSLPVRTLDPHLSLLTRTLGGSDAPTWVVRWDAPNAWGLDPTGQVDATLRAHYRQVATVCDRAVWLHNGATRDLAPVPAVSQCGEEVEG